MRKYMISTTEKHPTAMHVISKRKYSSCHQLPTLTPTLNSIYVSNKCKLNIMPRQAL